MSHFVLLERPGRHSGFSQLQQQNQSAHSHHRKGKKSQI